MTFSRTLPSTDDDQPHPLARRDDRADRAEHVGRADRVARDERADRVDRGDGAEESGGDRLRRLRGLDSTLDPGSRDPRPRPEGVGAGRWPVADGPRREAAHSAGPPDDARPSRSTSGSQSDPRADGSWWDPQAEGPAAEHGPLRAVAEAYTAANGHPTSHAGFEHVLDGGPRRWSVGARTAVVAAVAVLLLALAVGLWALADGDDLRAVASLDPRAGLVEGDGERGSVEDGSAPQPGPSTPLGGAAGSATAAPVVSDVVVHVVGAVSAPGLVTLPEGSRVADALTAAGDATAEADLAGVNLAREVVDGEQIVVPRPGEAVAAAAPAPAAGGGTAAGPVDLNSADEAALDALSGIGPVLAARIVEWREANGRFTTVEELGEVSGIGDALLARLRDQVRV